MLQGEKYWEDKLNLMQYMAVHKIEYYTDLILFSLFIGTNENWMHIHLISLMQSVARADIEEGKKVLKQIFNTRMDTLATILLKTLCYASTNNVPLHKVAAEVLRGQHSSLSAHAALSCTQ